MSKRSAALYLQDIKEAIEKIERFTEGLTFEAFKDDPKTVDAVVRNLEVIGEATKNIPDEIRTKYPDLPWRQMAGMRDEVSHEYFGVDLKIIWKTVKEDLGEVKKRISMISIKR